MNNVHLGLVLVLVSCSADQEVIPPGWKTIDAKYFEFQLPPGMEHDTKSFAFDSFARSYESESMKLGFDYGRYSDSLDLTYRSDGLSDVVRAPEVIDGHAATLVSYTTEKPTYFMAVHFPEVAQSSHGVIKLTMHCSYKSESDHAVVERILKSIKFRR